MKIEEYIQQAITVAKASERRDGIAAGAIIVNQKGQVVGEGMGLVTPMHDATLHGESMAIRDACKKMKTTDLDGCTLFGTIEPCGMCLSAALWANISKIYFGAYAKDIAANNYEYRDYSSEKLSKQSRRWDGTPIEVHGGVLRKECQQLMRSYKNWVRQFS
jgi:guanine deaminase